MARWPTCNRTEEYERIEEEPVWKSMTFHHFGLIVSLTFALIAVLLSFFLIWRHATHYLKPWEQRHIIRVLFMVPIYATVSFLSYLFYRHALYFEVIRDCYEAFAIASFFALLCHYTAPTLHSQKDYFRTLKPKEWVLPVNWFKRCCGGERGIWRTPRSGLTWFNIIWFGVFQYCFVRVAMTVVAVVTQATGNYCLESLNPAFANVWVMGIEATCVTIAMYCLIQFYVQLKNEISEHRPLIKVAAIKLVIFLSFWQNLLISLLSSTGVIEHSERFASQDIRVGLPSFLLCIEMAFFALFHLWAFPWKVYDVKRSKIVASETVPGFSLDPKTSYRGGWLGTYALLDAFNLWDLIKAIGRAFKWIIVGHRTREQDVSYLSSARGTGLEPIRIKDPSPRDNAPFDENDFSADPDIHHYYTGRNNAAYGHLDQDEEDDLLGHAQSVPQSHPPPYSAGPPSHADPVPDRNSFDRDRSEDIRPARQGTRPLNQDSEYHGAILTPVPPNPSHHRSRQDDDWEVWGSGSHPRFEVDGGNGGRVNVDGRVVRDGQFF